MIRIFWLKLVTIYGWKTSLLYKGGSTIKKVLILTIIIGVIVISLFVFEPFRSEPPIPTVTAGNTEIPATQGSYCWNGLLSAQCVDKVYTSPLEMAKEYKPTVVSPNEEIKMNFEKEPIAETLEVEKWMEEDNMKKVEVKNNSIAVPKEKGTYIYHVLASWEQGDGNYAFSVEVK